MVRQERGVPGQGRVGRGQAGGVLGQGQSWDAEPP